MRLRRDSIAIHLLHLQRKDSLHNENEVTYTDGLENIDVSGPDLLADTPSSINFVSELLSCQNEPKVKFSLPSKNRQTKKDENEEPLKRHLIELRETTTKGIRS